MIEVPNLTIDRDGRDPDTHVMLTQDFGGTQHMVSLHPCQVRLLAERMGMLAPDAEQQRIIARLSRQLRLLRERISTLDDWVNQAAQRGHENLSEEAIYSFATWELANEFCRDLPDATPEPVTCGHRPVTRDMDDAPTGGQTPAERVPDRQTSLLDAAGAHAGAQEVQC